MFQTKVYVDWRVCSAPSSSLMARSWPRVQAPVPAEPSSRWLVFHGAAGAPEATVLCDSLVCQASVCPLFKNGSGDPRTETRGRTAGARAPPLVLGSAVPSWSFAFTPLYLRPFVSKKGLPSLHLRLGITIPTERTHNQTTLESRPDSVSLRSFGDLPRRHLQRETPRPDHEPRGDPRLQPRSWRPLSDYTLKLCFYVRAICLSVLERLGGPRRFCRVPSA